MFNNYLVVVLRQLSRNGFYSVINISGLAIGLVASFLILLYVRDEISYDQFNENKDRIYRVAEEFKTGEGFIGTGLTPAHLAQALKDHFPQIERTARIDYDIDQFIVQYKDKKFLEKSISATEPEFFKIFSVRLLSGDPETILVEPFTMVISEAMARKYFGAADPVGEVMTLKYPYNMDKLDIKVSGVFSDMPHNSHFHKDFLLSSTTTEKYFPEREKEWGWTSHFTYIMLSPGHDIAEIEKQLPDFTVKKFSKEFADGTHFFIQPLTDIHLHSALKEEQEPTGDITYVYVFTSIAVGILLLACINYMNLATARASRRAKEIGIRKTVGAVRSKVISQFLGESVLISVIALLFAFLLAEIFIPLFNLLSGKDLEIDYSDPTLLIMFMGITMLTGILSGIYPAIILSSFKPVDVLRGGFIRVASGSIFLRKGLVILQFALSTTLIIGAIIVFQQWSYLQESKLGIRSDHILSIPISTQKIDRNNRLLKTAWLRNANIQSVTASNKKLTERPGNYTSVRVKDTGTDYSFPIGIVDHDFFKTFDIQVTQGRDFSTAFANDTVDSFIVNEAALKVLDLKNPIGAKVVVEGKEGTLIGVVKDFHFESLHAQIAPYVFYIRPRNFNHFQLKINSENFQETLSYIEKEFATIDPEANFSWSFLNDDIDNLYKSEARFFKVFITGSTLAIFIASLGIFGLISFTTSQRTKEIGIRKILGASIKGISILLTKDFIKLVLAASIIAWPLAWYFMDQWLQTFSYRISMNLWIFAGATVAALLVAISTISFQAIKAAMSNPVNSLRSE